MISSISDTHKRLLSRLSLYLTLIAVFIYFTFYNRYHLQYLEQTQLFRFSTSYIFAFFNKPGGLTDLLKAFMVQFFHISWLGALTITFLCYLAFKLTDHVFKEFGIQGVLFSLVPVLLIAGLHSHHQYSMQFTLGFLLSLAFYAWLTGITSEQTRWIASLAAYALLYILTGMFALQFLFLYILHELIRTTGIRRYLHILGALLLSTAVTYIVWRFVYLIPFKPYLSISFSLLSLHPVKLLQIALILFLPLVILITQVWQRINNRSVPCFPWNLQNTITGLLLYVALAFIVVKHSYDRNNELFLCMDSRYQKTDWNGVLKAAEKYPGQNQLVMYLTNLALYKTGNLSNNMFGYAQSGTKGLWLTWERNETAPFFGGEIYYHLGYTNEAFRWAFEAMEVKGLNPRSLKRLVITSLVNRDYPVASKYLNYLRQTLFYHKWANQYSVMLNDTSLISTDTELTEKRKLLISADFIAINNHHTIGLEKLLENHGDNRMAFEYLMASCLLKKDLGAFTANLDRIKDLGYKNIPIHYEEAILLYSGLTGKNPIPKGYTISNTTRERYRNYARVFAANRHNPVKAADMLFSQFGNTFWFYMQFANPNLNKDN